MTDNRIGSILVKLGYTTPERLSQAERAPGQDGLRFGERLIRLGIVQPQDLTHALAIQHNIPHINPIETEVPAEALDCIPAEIAERYRVLPLKTCDGQLHLGMADPFDVQALDDLAVLCGMEIVRCHASPAELTEAIRRYYGTSSARMADSLAVESTGIEGGQAEDAIGHLNDLVREPSLINFVNLIILEAIQDRASDIHIEPFEKQLKIKYRVDGVLHEMPSPLKHLQAAIISRIKIMANLNIAERFLPQDGHIKFHTPEAKVDIRVSTVPTMFGETVVLRLLDKSNTVRRLDQLGNGRAAAAAVRPGDPPAARDRAGHGPHGQRKDDHAVRGAAADLHARQEDDHDRGPGGVPDRRGQPDAGERQAGPDLRQRAAGDPAAGPRTSSWSARSATTRRSRSPSAAP